MQLSMTHFCFFNYTALWTLPERKHLLQTLILLVPPLIEALTLLRLGDQVVLLWLFAWLTVFPEILPLPHTSHDLPIYYTSFE